jgi:hypothetical protein
MFDTRQFVEIAVMRSADVRLEGGTAHRYNVETTTQIMVALFVYRARFCQVAPVGDAHL